MLGPLTPEPRGNGRGAFSETHWSLVLLAGQKGTPESERALEVLCQKYWRPIYIFLRQSGRSPHDAEDLCQEFFSRLLRTNAIAAVDPAKGRFRTYLLGALKHLLVDHARMVHAVKRGSGEKALSIDGDVAEEAYRIQSASEGNPERVFDRHWGFVLLEHALSRLREEFASRGKVKHYEVLKQFLEETPEPGAYATAADELGMTRGAIALTVHRMRERYRELVRAEVADTIANTNEVEEELRAIFLGHG